MVETRPPGKQPGGWDNWKAYPLLVSNQVDHALVKMQAERNLSRGKALNVVLIEGLTALGYLDRPKTPDQLRQQAADTESEWVKTHLAEMSPKARDYWVKRYPSVVVESPVLH